MGAQELGIYPRRPRLCVHDNWPPTRAKLEAPGYQVLVAAIEMPMWIDNVFNLVSASRTTVSPVQPLACTCLHWQNVCPLVLRPKKQFHTFWLLQQGPGTNPLPRTGQRCSAPDPPQKAIAIIKFLACLQGTKTNQNWSPKPKKHIKRHRNQQNPNVDAYLKSRFSHTTCLSLEPQTSWFRLRNHEKNLT